MLSEEPAKPSGRKGETSTPASNNFALQLLCHCDNVGAIQVRQSAHRVNFWNPAGNRLNKATRCATELRRAPSGLSYAGVPSRWVVLTCFRYCLFQSRPLICATVRKKTTSPKVASRTATKQASQALRVTSSHLCIVWFFCLVGFVSWGMHNINQFTGTLFWRQATLPVINIQHSG